MPAGCNSAIASAGENRTAGNADLRDISCCFEIRFEVNTISKYVNAWLKFGLIVAHVSFRKYFYYHFSLC